MEFVNQLVVICGWVIALGSAGTVIYTVITHINKPRKDIEKHVETIDKDMQEVKQKLERDYSAIQNQQKDISLLTKSMFGLIENKITGNNVDSLKDVRDELINSITNQKQ